MGEYTGDLKGFAEKAVGRVEEEGGKLLKNEEMERDGNKHRREGEEKEISSGLSDRAKADEAGDKA